MLTRRWLTFGSVLGLVLYVGLLAIICATFGAKALNFRGSVSPLEGVMNVLFALFAGFVFLSNIYMSLAGVLNTTTIEISPVNFAVRHSPIFWAGPLKVDLPGLKKLFIEEGNYSGLFRGRYASRLCYSICAMNERDEKLLLFKADPEAQPSGLTYTQVEFLTSLIANSRGIPWSDVEGEPGPNLS